VVSKRPAMALDRPVASTDRYAQRSPLRVLAMLAAATVADLALDPERRHVPLCPFHAMTGGQCPLCGGLRGVDALVHGRVLSAVHDNVLLVVGVPILGLWWLVWFLRARSGRPRPAWPRGATAALIGVAVVFTVVRNLPFATGLRP
jgi:hypothetical protein